MVLFNFYEVLVTYDSEEELCRIIAHGRKNPFSTLHIFWLHAELNPNRWICRRTLSLWASRPQLSSILFWNQINPYFHSGTGNLTFLWKILSLSPLENPGQKAIWHLSKNKVVQMQKAVSLMKIGLTLIPKLLWTLKLVHIWVQCTYSKVTFLSDQIA